MLININVEVHFVTRTDKLHKSEINAQKYRYRLYIDSELMTERSWLLSTNELIDENIWVDLSPGAYTLKLIPVMYPELKRFKLNNLRITKHSANPNNNLNYFKIDKISESEISFTVYKYSIPRENYEKPRIFKRI